MNQDMLQDCLKMALASPRTTVHQSAGPGVAAEIVGSPGAPLAQLHPVPSCSGRDRSVLAAYLDAATREGAKLSTDEILAMAEATCRYRPKDFTVRDYGRNLVEVTRTLLAHEGRVAPWFPLEEAYPIRLFWVISKLGGVSKASRKLNVAAGGVTHWLKGTSGARPTADHESLMCALVGKPRWWLYVGDLAFASPAIVIKATLQAKGVTLAALDRHLDLPAGTCGRTISGRKHLKAEAGIAAMLDLPLHVAWPDRHLPPEPPREVT